MPAIDLVARAKFVVVNHYQITFLVVPTIFFAVATVAVGLRWRVRRMKKTSFTVDDYLCAFTLLLGYAMIALMFFLVYETGEGLPTSFVMQHHPEVLSLWQKTTFALNIVWYTAVASIQISLLFFYLRLFNIVKWTRYACYLGIALICGWYFSTMVTWFNSCHPFPKFFNPALAGKCSIDTEKVCNATGLLHVGFDAFILLIPIPAIWTLKMALKKRLMIIGLLGLGIFATICSIIRMACIMDFWVESEMLDPIQGAWGPFLFSSLEVAIGIFCCCVPVLPPVFRLWRDQWNTSSIRSKIFKRSTSNNSTKTSMEHKAWAGNTIGGSEQKFVPLADHHSASSQSELMHINVTREYDFRS